MTGKQSDYRTGDGIFRIPFKTRRYRPVYAKKEQRIRLKRNTFENLNQAETTEKEAER